MPALDARFDLRDNDGVPYREGFPWFLTENLQSSKYLPIEDPPKGSFPGEEKDSLYTPTAEKVDMAGPAVQTGRPPWPPVKSTISERPPMLTHWQLS